MTPKRGCSRRRRSIRFSDSKSAWCAIARRLLCRPGLCGPCTSQVASRASGGMSLRGVRRGCRASALTWAASRRSSAGCAGPRGSSVRRTDPTSSAGCALDHSSARWWRRSRNGFVEASLATAGARHARRRSLGRRPVRVSAAAGLRAIVNRGRAWRASSDGVSWASPTGIPGDDEHPVRCRLTGEFSCSPSVPERCGWSSSSASRTPCTASSNSTRGAT